MLIKKIEKKGILNSKSQNFENKDILMNKIKLRKDQLHLNLNSINSKVIRADESNAKSAKTAAETSNDEQQTISVNS